MQHLHRQLLLWDRQIVQSSQSSSEAGSLDASSAVNFVNNGLKVYNINFKNAYGTGAQAVAIKANSNYQGFYGCSFLGFRDTLYAKSGEQYYKYYYMEGSVDFICGDAAAWFGACTIATKQSGGAVTASSRALATHTTWYVFDTCTVQAATGYSLARVVYLGRPWRALARVIFQNSILTDVVATAGWTKLVARRNTASTAHSYVDRG